jgi:amidase
LLAQHRLAALIAPTRAPAAVVDTVNGDHDLGGAATLPAVAGYPHVSVPMGLVRGLPVGLSIIGPAWSERLLLGFAYAFEQARGPLPRPGFAASTAYAPPLSTLLAPLPPLARAFPTPGLIRAARGAAQAAVAAAAMRPR